MRVKAAPGLSCPVEGNPRKYIADTGTVEVAENAYYTRLVSDGSLIRTDGPEEKEAIDGQ